MGERVVYMGVHGLLHGNNAIHPVNRVYMGDRCWPQLNHCKMILLGPAAVTHGNPVYILNRIYLVFQCSAPSNKGKG